MTGQFFRTILFFYQGNLPVNQWSAELREYMICDNMRIIELIISFVSGGLVVALIEWYRAYRASTHERRLQIIRDQLEKLYGPIFFFTSQNQECFAVSKKLHAALNSEKTSVVDKDGNRQSLLTIDEVKQTIDLSNEYVHLVTRNNDQIVDIFKQSWSLVDAEDIDLFRQMIVDYTRLKVEVGTNGKMKTPFLVYPQVGEISFMRPEFMTRIEARVREKQDALKKSAGMKE